MILIHVDLPDDEAHALAQMLKRVGYDDYRRLAQSDQQAYAMQSAGEKVRTALAEQGLAPR